jgi:hypothetical protein
MNKPRTFFPTPLSVEEKLLSLGVRTADKRTYRTTTAWMQVENEDGSEQRYEGVCVEVHLKDKKWIWL